MLRHTTQNPTMLLYALLWTVLCSARLGYALLYCNTQCDGLCFELPSWNRTLLQHTMRWTVLCHTRRRTATSCSGLCCAIMVGHAVGDAEQRRAPPYPAPDCAVPGSARPDHAVDCAVLCHTKPRFAKQHHGLCYAVPYRAGLGRGLLYPAVDCAILHAAIHCQAMLSLRLAIHRNFLYFFLLLLTL